MYMRIDKSRENRRFAEVVHPGVGRHLIGRYNAPDFPILDDDRSRTNPIRRHDPRRNESLPVHARAYPAGPPFSTFQREGSGLVSSQKCFAYFLAPLILAALIICLNIGCERVHVDRFARRFLGSFGVRTPLTITR